VRSGRDDNSSWKLYLAFPNKIVIPSGAEGSAVRLSAFPIPGGSHPNSVRLFAFLAVDLLRAVPFSVDCNHTNAG